MPQRPWCQQRWNVLVYCGISQEKAVAPHSSTLAWRIPWAEEPGRLQSMGSQRVGHGWVTSLSLSCTGEGNGNPLQCSYLENPRDRGAWWVAVYGVTQSRTRLKRLSSSSTSSRPHERYHWIFHLLKGLKMTEKFEKGCDSVFLAGTKAFMQRYQSGISGFCKLMGIIALRIPHSWNDTSWSECQKKV